VELYSNCYNSRYVTSLVFSFELCNQETFGKFSSFELCNQETFGKFSSMFDVISNSCTVKPRIQRHPHLVPMKIFDQKFAVIRYFDLPPLSMYQPNTVKKLWRSIAVWLCTCGCRVT
jgi:hypothetical protein